MMSDCSMPFDNAFSSFHPQRLKQSGYSRDHDILNKVIIHFFQYKCFVRQLSLHTQQEGLNHYNKVSLVSPENRI